MKRGTPLAEKLATYSEVRENGCRVWTGGKKGRRGAVRDGDKVVEAHVAAWTLINGPVPFGYCVDQTCPGGDDPLCINVDHLMLRTYSQQHRSRIKKGRRPRRYRRRPREMVEGDL